MSWRNHTAARWAVAALVGFAVVAILAHAAKWIIESTTDLVYEIHWRETVPLITLLFAFVLQRMWRPEQADEP